MPPTFVLVAGSWHQTTYYEPLVRALADADYPSVAVSPRCVDSSPPATSFQPDVDAVKEAIAELSGKDVILVLHSYGGLVGTEAVGDLVANQQGVAARIKRVVYLAALLPLKGETFMMTALSAPEARDHDYFDIDDGYVVLRDVAEDLLYHDVPEPERSRCAAVLGKQPASVHAIPLEHASYAHVPSTYVVTARDRVVTPANQKWTMERTRSHVLEAAPAGGVEPFSGPLGVFSIDTGHSPMAAKPVELAKILGRVAEGV